jgi:RNA polymerase sigma-70 factor (ECF subfamily)
VRDVEEFTAFVRRVEPQLQQAMVARYGLHAAADAVADALAYAWEHWNRVGAMENPAGYVYRTAVSRTRDRRLRPEFPPPEEVGLPDVDPRLPKALRALTGRQRETVYLVVACDWPHARVAEWLDIGESSVRNHLSRGLARLREELEVDARA